MDGVQDAEEPARFPRSSAYHPDWILAGASGGAHPLWLTEWLTEAMDLRAGMRVLDLGSGRGTSSVFLRREFGVQVWSVDLWFDPGERLARFRDAGVDDAVFPLRADARSLPFAPGFFDAVVSVELVGVSRQPCKQRVLQDRLPWAAWWSGRTSLCTRKILMVIPRPRRPAADLLGRSSLERSTRC